MKVYGQLEKAQWENLALAPTPASTGQIFWDTAIGAARQYDGTYWRMITPVTTSKAANFTAALTEEILICTAALTASLPAISTCPLKRYIFKLTTTALVTINPNGADTIDGVASLTLTQTGQFVELVADLASTKWLVIAGGGTSYSTASVMNGYGSTNTQILRYTTQATVGTDFTYADSATLGGSWTIVRAGLYAMSLRGAFSAASTFGITKNSSQLTTAIQSTTDGSVLNLARTPAADTMVGVAATRYLAVGDVIRAHGGATTVGATNNATTHEFHIARIR